MITSLVSEEALPGEALAGKGETDSTLRILMVEDSEADAELAKSALMRGGLNFSAEVVFSRETFLA